MFRNASCLSLAIILVQVSISGAQSSPDAPLRMSSESLARWIDERFAAAWQESKTLPATDIDDATFLRRAYLDLTGSIPSVSEARDFLAISSGHRRALLIDRLLNDRRRPEKHADRTAAYLATVWRRMMIPGNTPEARTAVLLEPWLAQQFVDNVPYDEVARKLVTARSEAPVMMNIPNRAVPMGSAGPAFFYQAIGGKPEAAASSVSRIFLGVRIGCAECHDHPFAAWKQKDFWGMAAFFSGIRNGVAGDSEASIRPENSTVSYSATYLGGTPAKFEKGKTPREALADWMVDDSNSLFAATAVNRVWKHLIGRGLTDSVDDLDKASAEERRILDELAVLFVKSGYDLRWLIAGICKSQLYQRECVLVEQAAGDPGPGQRPVKTLSPEQIFNSLEQALSLPIARADGGARFNGLRDQLIMRLSEAATNNPDEFRAGIPQALLLMNGKLTADATNLDQSRTLRGVVESPFLDTTLKLETLYLATFSRPPRPDEKEFLLEHIHKQTGEMQKQAFAEIFWGLLNSPEFVLQK